MATLQEAQEKAKQRMQAENPSVAPGKTAAERKRIPMTLPQLKLEVPEIPGYHLHWFRGDAARIQAAQNAGYEFVLKEEVQTNNVALGGDATKSGDSDLGSRVSIAGGSTDGQGQPVRLYLMKQKLEWYLADQKLLEDRNDQVAAALTASYKQGQVGGQVPGETATDASLRYVNPQRSKIPEMFRKKTPRG